MSTRRDVFQLLAGAAAVGGGAFCLGRGEVIDTIGSFLKPKRSDYNPNNWMLADRDGSTFQLASQEQPGKGLMLYFIRANCEWCARNRIAVNAVAEQLQGRYRTLGILTEGDWPGTENYIFPVFRLRSTGPNDEIVRVTPATLLLSPTGSKDIDVEGAYVGTTKTELESKLGLIIPPLTGITI